MMAAKTSLVITALNVIRRQNDGAGDNTSPSVPNLQGVKDFQGFTGSSWPSRQRFGCFKGKSKVM
jgi:hypothetical protein